jgi:hypothetical protein
VTIPTQQDRDSAKETLAYIRRTMESASTFTAVSGWGLVGVGAVGLVAAWVAGRGDDPTDLRVWLPAAFVSIVIAVVSNVGKAKRTDVPIWSGALRRLVWVMVPALAAGAMLTIVLARDGSAYLLPGMWLALYGAGVAAGGEFSIRGIRWMGVSFLLLGAAALLRPDLGLPLMAAGFGGLHILVGLNIVWRHGG